MAKFRLEDIPMKDLQALGLHDGKDYLLDRQTQEALLSGHLTKFLHFRDLNIDGAQTISLEAKLSLRRKVNGKVGLFVHPIYKQPLVHPDLTQEEAQEFAAKGGVHTKSSSAYGTIVEYGNAAYLFDRKNKDNFFIKLKKANGQTVDMWGVDLERALQQSGHGVGDKVQLNFLGKERVFVDVPIYDSEGNTIGSETKETDRNKWEIKDFDERLKKEKAVMYEFDAETNSFVSVDEENVLAPDEINGMRLTDEQKREYRQGRVVALEDGTEIRSSPASKNGIRSNKRLLLVSMVIDGGISFVLYHAVNALAKIRSGKKQRENEYSKGYSDALTKMQIELERKQARYPDDPTIADDLETVRKERERMSTESPKQRSKDENDFKSKVNDPDLERNAEQRDGQKQQHREEAAARAESDEREQQGRRR